MKRLIGYCLCIALLTGLFSCSGKPSLEMSYRSADISTTPEEHTILAGFAARNKLSDGIHQKIYTHCLVLKEPGGEQVCLISNDLMELSPAISDTIRTMISERAGFPKDRILMHCIHTHSAPRSGGPSIQEGGTNRAWKIRMVETVVSNAVQAITDERAFAPFTMEVGKAHTSINANRCEKGGPVDHDVYVARFLQKGRVRVSIVNLACHPVCMGPKSLALSSDYPGVAARYLSKAWGGEVFQLTGAAGNMDPVLGPRDSTYAGQCGKSLADSLVGMSFRKIPDAGYLNLVNETVDLPYQIDSITPEAVMHHADSLAATASKVSASFGDDVRRWEKEILDRFTHGEVPSKLRYHLHALDVNGVLFFFSDGEPFCEYQMETRAAFPDRTIFFAGYTNGQNSYLPSKRAYQVHKGYEYETEQMHIYIKAPYPLSSTMPDSYLHGVEKTIADAIQQEPSL